MDSLSTVADACRSGRKVDARADASGSVDEAVLATAPGASSSDGANGSGGDGSSSSGNGDAAVRRKSRKARCPTAECSAVFPATSFSDAFLVIRIC